MAASKTVAFRVVTTTGSYTSTIPEEGLTDFDPEEFAQQNSETISSTDKANQAVIIHADGIGWVGFNTNYIVAVEILEERSF